MWQLAWLDQMVSFVRFLSKLRLSLFQVVTSLSWLTLPPKFYQQSGELESSEGVGPCIPHTMPDLCGMNFFFFLNKCFSSLCAPVWLLPFANIYTDFSCMNFIKVLLGGKNPWIFKILDRFVPVCNVGLNLRLLKELSCSMFWIGGYANITFDVSGCNIDISSNFREEF